jgi:hypothetical protein
MSSRDAQPFLKNTRVLDAERRAWSYWFVDGLFNILSGTGFLLLAASFGIDKKRSTLNFVIAACCYFLYLAIILRRERILDWLKSRVTYPRTGYVPYPYKPPSAITELRIDDPEPETPPDVRRARRNRTLRSLTGMLGFGVALALLAIVNTPWICLVASVLFGFALCSMNARGMNLSWIVVLGMPFVGLCMSLLQIVRFQRANALMAGAGIVLLIDGTVTLIRYLRRNPVARA